MPTLVMDPTPADFEALVKRREASGLDRWDEVWEGVLHMDPPPSRAHERIASMLHRLLGSYSDAAGLDLLGGVGIGVVDDHRVPDIVLQRSQDAQPQWQGTVELAVEIRSPGDETLKKLDFYAAHQVNELVSVDPQKHTVEWLALAESEYRNVERSNLIDLGASDLTEQIDWPT